MDNQNPEKAPENVGETGAPNPDKQVLIEHDPAAEARVRRKLDTHMMPLFFVLCASHKPPPLSKNSQTV